MFPKDASANSEIFPMNAPHETTRVVKSEGE